MIENPGDIHVCLYFLCWDHVGHLRVCFRIKKGKMSDDFGLDISLSYFEQVKTRGGGSVWAQDLKQKS